jgi:hypothetical protein
MEKRWRFADFKEAGLFNNRTSLKNAQEKLGFPLGELTGENQRTWGDGEVQTWIKNRPSKPRITNTPPRPRGRPRKLITPEVIDTRSTVVPRKVIKPEADEGGPAP